jgi:hypothetical protein
VREPSGSRTGTRRPWLDDGSWRGVISLGYGPDGKRVRRKVRGQTKTEVRDKLRDLHSDIEAGIRKPAAVTVQQAADDWVSHDLDGRSAKTVRKNRESQ